MSLFSNITLNLLLQAAAPIIQTAATISIPIVAGLAAHAFSSIQKKTAHGRLTDTAWQLVLAAEQKFVDNSEKQAYVLDLLKKQFPKVRPEFLDAAMEGAVAAWKNARTADSATKIMEVAG